MKAVFLSVILAVTGCAHTSGPHPINVHSVRVAIKDRISASPGEQGPRAIISMGKVTDSSAVVYTESSAHARLEETWIKGPSGWALQESRSVAVQ